MPYDLIIFDLDGTLADSFAFFVSVHNQLADRHGFRHIAPAEIETLRGRPAREIMHHVGLPLQPSSMAATSSGAPSAKLVPSAKVAEPPAKTYHSVVSATSVTLSSSTGPRCKDCQGVDGSVQYGKYRYYFQCAKCGANTAIKFACQAGHKPRLRKAGNPFYRECAECNTSEIYFINL